MQMWVLAKKREREERRESSLALLTPETLADFLVIMKTVVFHCQCVFLESIEKIPVTEREDQLPHSSGWPAR